MESRTPEEDRKKAGAWNGSIHQKNIKETSKDSESMIQNPGTRSAQYTTINIEESRNQIGTTFHSEYRSIQTKVNNVAHTTTQNSFRAQEGGGAGGGPSGYGTLRWPSPCIFPH